MKALTAAEMREVDRLTTERFGISGEELMEAAGRSLAEEFLARYGQWTPTTPQRVCVLCGKGNNGGDGLVVARYLKEEAEQVDVYLFARASELQADAAKNLQEWRNAGGEVVEVVTAADWDEQWPEIAAADVIIDALLGTGIRGAATGLIGKTIEAVNQLSGKATLPRPGWIVGVDTPSGLLSDGEKAEGPVLRAHLTVTFTAPKIGQLVSPDAACCGKIVVREIGSPASLVEEVGKGNLRWAGPEEFASLPLIRAVDAFKNSYGHVLLVAGSAGKSGAAVLAGQSALRAGAGLVTIATAEPVQAIVAASQPEYMTEALESTKDGAISGEAIRSGKFAEILQGKTVLAMGPGIGTQAETQEFVRVAFRTAEIPVVLDADGLNAFANQGDLLSKRKSAHLVVTPHPGEMARLLGSKSSDVEKNRLKVATEAARRWNAHVVLKGFHTLVVAPDGKILVNTTGNAGLAKAGSGDVLTGSIAALVAQFGCEDLHKVVALGVYLHGLAAEILSLPSDVSGLLAGEIAQAVPFARRKLIQDLQTRGLAQ
jgi:ADP-dependent NAD(P)H-hydrate dehydratase / NAD(P)H-hydrate epimerase